MAIYEKRLGHYLNFESRVLPDIKSAKNMQAKVLKEKEGQLVLSKLNKDTLLVLLDERGKSLSSVKFAELMNQKMEFGTKDIVFLIGGAFGFSQSVYDRADLKISLSKMTFSHQMIRLFLFEQIYRAMTILRGEPYHNEG